MSNLENHHQHHHENEADHFHDPLPCDGEGHQHHHHADGSCCCEQHAKEFHGIDKPMLIRLIIAALLYLAAMILPVGETAEMIMMLCSALVSGYDIILAALKNLLRAKVFDEYFLMSFAAVAAFLIGEYEEAAAVFLLYRIGAFCQSYAIRHSRRKVASLTGDYDLLEEDDRVKNRFITRFAKIYTPVILILAIMIAVALPLLGAAEWHESVYRALTFLVLACPCAIVISVPLAYFAGIGAASKRGVFFHDSTAVDEVSASKDCLTQPETQALSEASACVYSLKTHAGDCTHVVLESPDQVPLAYTIAKKTHRIAMENVWFPIIVKLAVLILSVCGVSALWFAVFADSGVTVIVVLNALRAFRIGKQIDS